MPSSKPFQKYLKDDFPKALNVFVKKTIDNFLLMHEKVFQPSECPHHQVPIELCFPFDAVELSQCEPHFICSLYVTTSLNEAVHHFSRKHKSDQFKEWQKQFGTYPIPMIYPFGFGCYHAVHPYLLLFRSHRRQVFIPSELWDEVCSYFVNDVPEILSTIGLDPNTFLKQLVDDKDFNYVPNIYEEQLKQQLSEKWDWEETE